MDKQYNELNEFLDKCINEALQETTNQFQVGVDHTKGVDYEQYKKSDRFNGFKEDKNDPEGEKMKDYERPSPYKIHQRPLTEEEIRSYQQYEEDMRKIKPGQTRPNWAGFDKSKQGFDKTEEYSKYMKPRSNNTTEEPKGPNQRFQQAERKEEPEKEMFKSSTKSENIQRPNEPDWTHRNNINVQEEPHTYQNFTRPKFNPNLYQPTVKPEEKPSKERWTYKPKFSNVEKPLRSTFQETSTDRTRRYSDPTSSYQKDFPSSDDFKSEGKFQTYENFYKNVAKSDLKPDYYKEHRKPEPPQDVQGESRAEEKKKEKMLQGTNEEEVKHELLKLRPAIMERASWGALPPMGKVTQMKPPADTVVFTLNTGTPECNTEEQCRRTVKEIQARHMGKGLADIQYNFLVGGDGNLYEGRGWAYESGIKQEKQQGKNYNIAFIGNYQDNVNTIPPQMLGPVQELIVWGNAIRLMTKDTKSAGEYRFQQKEGTGKDLPTSGQ